MVSIGAKKYRPKFDLVTVAIEEVIDPSFCKIIKGEGLLDKERNIRGDLIITFHIHFPKKLL